MYIYQNITDGGTIWLLLTWHHDKHFYVAMVTLYKAYINTAEISVHDEETKATHPRKITIK